MVRGLVWVVRLRSFCQLPLKAGKAVIFIVSNKIIVANREKNSFGVEVLFGCTGPPFYIMCFFISNGPYRITYL